MQVDPGVTVIGTQSAGTNGNVSEFVLPGGIRSCFSGLGWYYPGGWSVQRLEVRLDLEVEPTIGGVRAGRDETREAAVETINGRFPRSEEERGYSPAGALTEGRISSAEAPHFRLGRLPILSTRVPPSMMSSWLIQHFV